MVHRKHLWTNLLIISKVAYARLAGLYLLRALGTGGGMGSDIMDSIRWAAGVAVDGAPANPHPARVINLSLGGTGNCSEAYQEAIDELRHEHFAAVPPRLLLLK